MTAAPATESPPRRRRGLETAGAALVLIALAIVLTWPQAKHLATHAYGHHDVYFNMWRLGWIEHALVNSPQRLFDGNIFYPERRSLTYSDAIIVPGLIGTPLLMAGLPQVLVHNLLLLGAIIGSALGVFVLARHLTGSAGAGLVAGIVFAFVPYRFEHYMHMEMQWTMWMAWAFWAMHRAFETRQAKFGLLTGFFVSLQMLSSIYYGVFLIVVIGVAALLLLLPLGIRDKARTVAALAPAAVVVAVLCGAYAMPYLETKKEVGGRGEREIMLYSARPSNYLVATPENVIYGEMFQSRGRPERRLFPGTLVTVLAIFGLFLRPRASIPIVITYLAAMVLSFEMSLGLSGYSYRFLFDYVPVFGGFRAVARLGIFVVFFLSVLAAFGYAALTAETRPRVRKFLLAAAVVVLALEYRVRSINLIEFPNEPPPLYAWLAQQPPGVVAELPMPKEVPGSDPRTSYLSTFHWQPIVNGYSGFVPNSYLDRLDDLKFFPDDRAIARLRRDNVRYLVVHLVEYWKDERIRTVQALTERHRLREIGRFHDGLGEAAVYFLQ